MKSQQVLFHAAFKRLTPGEVFRPNLVTGRHFLNCGWQTRQGCTDLIPFGGEFKIPRASAELCEHVSETAIFCLGVRKRTQSITRAVRARQVQERASRPYPRERWRPGFKRLPRLEAKPGSKTRIRMVFKRPSGTRGRKNSTAIPKSQEHT